MSEAAAKTLINQERLTIYDLISDQKIHPTVGAKALSNLEIALGDSGGGGGSIDVSTLAKETTLTGINSKLPALESSRIPVSLPGLILTPDRRILTTNTTIPEGSIYVYLKVVLGDVMIDGLTYSTNEYVNYESCYPCRHPEINLIIPEGTSVRLNRGY